MTDIILSTERRTCGIQPGDCQRFGKEHKHVLSAIRQILVAENSATKFFPTETTVSSIAGQKFPEYLMNRDGFSLLAMALPARKPYSGS